MPMVTFFKTLDVTRLIKVSRRNGYKFNMLMCWCIGKAASQTEEFYLLPAEKKMLQYDSIAVSTVVTTKDGGISTSDIPFSESLEQFGREYLRLTHKVQDTCLAYALDESWMVIGTSALAQYKIDGAVNLYAGFYQNPFFIWGRYRKKWLKTMLTVSFQFHHTQMDGIAAACFLEHLQKEISQLQA